MLKIRYRKKRKLLRLLQKKIENNCLLKFIILKKVNEGFEDRKARLASYTEKKFPEELPNSSETENMPKIW